ncbi:hypothetical protein BC829DRAFT_389458, partial [Chytridium lagenaria]
MFFLVVCVCQCSMMMGDFRAFRFKAFLSMALILFFFLCEGKSFLFLLSFVLDSFVHSRFVFFLACMICCFFLGMN